MLLAYRRVFALLAVVLITALSASASTPVRWQTSTLNELARGEVENLSIDNSGRLMLGPAADLTYETTAPFLWSMLAAPDGSLYVGSGNEGKVFRVDPGGKGSVFFDATELEVHAIALAPDGGLYAGTSPDGQIYKLDRQGAARPFFDPEDKYIWALAVDASGNVYAATGEKGAIYKITPDGKGAPFYQTKTTHAIALAFDREGNLLAGTESPGRLFRIDRSGKAFLLLDSAFQEISAVHVDAQGSIYVDVGAGSVPQGEVTTRDDRRTMRGAIYRIRPNGLWDLLWESRDDSPYDLTFDADGSLIVGTGRGGRLFRLSGDPMTPTLLMRASGQQVTGFARDAKGNTYYTTSNPGKVFRLSSQRSDQGAYVSEVRDAQTVANWGTLSWRASIPSGSRVELYTRSGNTATPDDTWSLWAGPYQHADGEQITSPNARYLQWKAVLTGKQTSPALTSVVAAYLQRNARPKVTSITIHPAGTVFQKPFSTGELEIAGFDGQAPDRRALSASPGANSSAGASNPAAPPLGRRVYQKGLQAFVWRAEDDNADDLQYDILYRAEGETTWKVLRKSLSDAIFVWDTTSVPDGAYTIKIVASDAASNPPGAALQGELESTAFEIDNTPPGIAVTGSRRDGGRVTLLFTVRDEESPVQKVEYSLNAERWQTIYPKDGIFDSRVEDFELTLEGDALAQGVIIRAIDAKNNIATIHADASPERTR
jgi:sugar lactone lactonase YvrE